MARATNSDTENERRLEILAAAAEIFAERGIANTTVRDIGSKVGILSGSLYYHFRSKDDMVLELLDRHLRIFIADHEAAIANKDPLVALRAAIRQIVYQAAEYPTIVRILRNNASYFRTIPALASVEKLRQSNRLLLISLVKRCIETGEIRDDVNPDMVVRAMFDGAMGTTRWFPPQGRRKPDAVANQIVALFLDGLCTGRRK